MLAPSSSDILVVMAKYPEPGAVKTRLARSLGDDAACELYRAFLVDIAARFAAAPWKLMWAVHPAGADLRRIVGADAVVLDQRGRDLAARMKSCFSTVRAAGGRRVVMMGADAPHLTEEVVARAFAALFAADAVLVPARDGGYALIGLRSPADVFTGIEMSTPVVFERTTAKMTKLGLSFRVLPESFDVDELDDLRELDRLLRRGSVTLPATAEVLQDRKITRLLRRDRS